MSNRSLVNLLQTMTPAVRQSPLRALFLAVAVALCGLMTVADLPSPSPVHAQEQEVTATRDATGEDWPERPTNLQGSASHDSVTLTWTASTDDTVTHYAVLRRDRNADASGVFHVIDSNAGPSLSYTDRSVSAEGSYVYRVKAVNTTGVSQWSSYARADTPPDPADLAPSGLSAKAVSDDDGVIEGVALAWNAPAEDAASVTGYEILRAQGDGELATLVADTGSADTTYTDATATEAGESYAYRVKALRGEEASQSSDPAVAIIPKVTVQPSEPLIADRQNATVVWTATLNPADIGLLGCTDASPPLMHQCSTSSRLSEDQVQYDGTTYLVTSIGYFGNIEPIGSMVFDTNPDLPAEAVADLTLNIGDTSLLLSEATGTNFNVQFEWLNSGVSMAVGTDVTVSLTEGAVQADTTPPALESATVSVNGRAIGLLFDEVLDDSIFTLPISLVSVTADGSAVIVGEVAIRTDPSSLTHRLVEIGKLSPAITHGQVVTVSYSDPTTGDDTGAVIQDAAGNDVASFTTGSGDVPAVVNSVDEPPSATVVWTATLNPGDIGSIGCTDASPLLIMLHCSQLSRLSEDQIQYDGTTYLVTSILYNPSIEPIGSMLFETHPDLPAEAVADLTLNIGDTSLLLSEATGTNFTGIVQFEWLNSGVSMAVDTDITVSLTGGAGSTNEEENAAPVFTSAAAFSVEENQTAVGTVIATDADAGDTVTYAVTGGADQAHLQIGSTSGVLTFTTAPDHESPTDDGGNNVYQVTVTATGGTGARAMTATQDITVTVTDVDDTPAVASVVVTSDPGADETYAIGETIEVTVTFDRAVTVTGTPRIQLRIGGGASNLKWANYSSGNEALVFAYTVQAGDEDDNGIYIGANQLFLNGGTIQSAEGTDADLAYTEPGAQSGHKVDGVRPTPVLAVTSDDGASIIILFSEPLHMTTAPASAFTLAVDTGTAPAVSSATASGDKVTLALASALTSDQAATVTYVDATSGNDDDAIQDAAGNDAANFTTGEGDVPDVANAVGAGCSLADGCYVVPANWGLIPSGLGAGDRFRLLFISSIKRNALSTDIVDYNTFVQDRAAAGHADIRDYSAVFRVLGSTADVDARDNTNTRYTGDETAATDDDSNLGVAIYWLSGAKVADDYKDFYDGSWSNAGAGKNEKGAANENPLITTHSGVYTGSSSDGTENTESIGPIPESRGLGTERVRVSNPALTPSSKVNSSWLGPFYGLSGVFLVQGQPNAAPVFTSADTFSAAENQTAVGTVIATDADAGDAVSYAVTGGADRAHFEIDASSGILTFGTAPDHENPTDAGGNNVYQVTVTATGGTGNRALTATQDITVTVTDVDEPPCGTLPAGQLWFACLTVERIGPDIYGLTSYPFVGTLVPDSFDIGTTTYTVTHLFDTDLSGGSPYVSITFSPALSVVHASSLTLHLGDDTSLYFGDASYTTGTGFSRYDWSLPAALGWSAGDAIVVGITQESTPPPATNAAPVFTSAATFSAEENQTAVDTVEATDADAEDMVTYAVTGGDDQAHFVIDSSSGVLTFATAPDHENPGDADTDNVYQVTVTATGGTGARAMTATQDIAVTVTDVDEPPSATVVWTATLNPGDIGPIGCTDVSPLLITLHCFQLSRLSEDQIQYDGTTYLVTSILYYPSIEPIGSMLFDTHPDLPAEAVADLTLNIGDTSLLLSEATGTNFTGTIQFEWLNSGVSMAVDTDVTVSLTEGAGSTNEEENATPVFTSAAAFSVEENQTLVGTVMATDADAGDAVSYAVTGGADRAHFEIDASSGILAFATAPDHENPTDDGDNNVYQVTVTATGGTGARALTATQDITVTVTDVDEPPAAPAAPTVSPVTGSSDSLDVSWTAPDNTGKPDIESYDLRYRKENTVNWTDGPQDETGLSATISGLDAASEYQVQVQATNDEGDSDWSSAGTGTTNAQAQAPRVLSITRLEGTYAIEAKLSVTVVFSAAVTVSGTPQLALDIGGETRQADYEADYESGAGTQSLLFSYTVAEGDEDTDGIEVLENGLALNGGAITAGGAAATLTHVAHNLSAVLVDGVRPTLVSAETSVDGNTVSVTFSESILSANATKFEVSPGGDPSVSSAIIDANDDTVVTLMLSRALSHDETPPLEIAPNAVQDAAGNDNSSLSGSITNNVPPPANNPPMFTSADNFTADENQMAVGTVIATDADAGDTVTYAVTGGADQAHFQIVAASGVLTFATAPDHEDPADADTNNTYLVTVTATGGTGARALTTEQDITVIVNDVDETPAVASVDVTSTPSATTDTYGLDETIEVTVTFDQAVTVTGTPRIQLRIGGGGTQHLKWADYSSGSGNEALVFAYTVQAGDMDDNGIYIEADELFLNGGTIQGVDDDVAATLTYTRPGTQSGHKVDGSLTTAGATNAAPVFTSADTFSADEKQTAVGTVMATDADAGDTVSYAVTGGDDQARFQIVAASGVLTFATAPDHEDPADADSNNVYLVTVTATGGTGARALSTEQAITVTVNDVDETPAVTSVDVTSTPTAMTDTYGRDETIEVTVTFDQAVTVTGTPRIQLRIGGGAQDNLKWANYASGSGNEALVFAYTVQAGDMDDNGIYIEANELELNGGTIQGVDDDVAATLTYTRPGTQSGHKVDGSLTTAGATTAPGAPTGLTATADRQTVIDLSWTAPTDTGGGAITGYRIEVLPDGGTTWTDVVADTGSTGTTYRHPNRTPGATYQYRVSAINSAGTGPASGTASATTGAPPTGDFVSVCDRSPSMKFSLVYEVFGITLTTDLDEACQRVTQQQLANIYSLTVWGPSSLSARDLDGLTGLRLMSLSRGSLDSLPKGIFGGLGKLEKLNILYTDLDELDPAIFGERADDLKSLALWGNDITSLPAGVFDGLTALENLSIIEQGIQTLPADLLDDNTKLKKLTMRIGSGWTQMESGFLSDLGELRELHLGGNGLTSLPDGVFDHNRKLKKVYLYDNALASLPDGVFNNNTALEKVYLADNALASLPDGIFDNTAKLKTVDLRNNELATLPRDLFPHGEPGKLYLSGNPGHPFTFD